MFEKLFNKIRQVGNIITGTNYDNLEQTLEINPMVSPEMKTKMNVWRNMYEDQSPWLSDTVSSLNISSYISKEIALLTMLELKSEIVSTKGNKNEKLLEYANRQYQRLLGSLRIKLEEAQAVGGMIIKPYVNLNDGEIYFTFTMQDDFVPLAFDGNGKISDAIFVDKFVQNGNYFTRAERHKVLNDGTIQITHKCYCSSSSSILGTEVPLSMVEKWSNIEPESYVKNANGELFGYYKVALANNVDEDSPLGVSIYSKAEKLIRDADEQYSRLKWEFEGGELAVDVPPEALLPVNKTKVNTFTTPKLNKRLFRAVDLGVADNYNVFNPTLRDQSILNGLNAIYREIERLAGLASGTLSDPSNVVRTATELNIVKHTTAATISDNQKALQMALEDVIRTIGVYINTYNLAPSGSIVGNFEWGDSILSDTDKEYQQKMELMSQGIISKAEIRAWYLGEDIEKSKEEIDKIKQNEPDEMKALFGE